MNLAAQELSLHLALRHNNRTVHEVPASAGLLDRIEVFFGAEVRKGLIMVEAEQSGMTLGGYVADPICEAGGTQMQYVFVNGRFWHGHDGCLFLFDPDAWSLVCGQLRADSPEARGGSADSRRRRRNNRAELRKLWGKRVRPRR